MSEIKIREKQKFRMQSRYYGIVVFDNFTLLDLPLLNSGEVCNFKILEEDQNG